MRAFVLDFDGTRRPIETGHVLSVAHAGSPVVVEGALQAIGWHTRIVDLYLDAIAAVVSPAVATDLRGHGLERMHDLVEPDQVVEILTRLNEVMADLAVPVSPRSSKRRPRRLDRTTSSVAEPLSAPRSRTGSSRAHRKSCRPDTCTGTCCRPHRTATTC